MHYKNYRPGYNAVYFTWFRMKDRCYNPERLGYADYGGRGITVCDRWLGSDGFMNFWNDMGDRPDGHSLDRKDVNGNYEPNNCRWATQYVQKRNRRNNRWVNYQGKSMILKDAAKVAGIKYTTVYARMARGLSVEEALTA